MKWKYNVGDILALPNPDYTIIIIGYKTIAIRKERYAMFEAYQNRIYGISKKGKSWLENEPYKKIGRLKNAEIAIEFLLLFFNN